MENFFQYPARPSLYIYVQKKSAVYGFDGITILTTHDDPTAAKARYIAACLNACKDMDTETLESGAAGWIAGKLASCKPENPFLGPLIETTNECIKSQLSADFKAIELQKQLDAANAENEIIKSRIEAVTAERLQFKNHLEETKKDAILESRELKSKCESARAELQEVYHNFQECADRNIVLVNENNRLQKQVEALVEAQYISNLAERFCTQNNEPDQAPPQNFEYWKKGLIEFGVLDTLEKFREATRFFTDETFLNFSNQPAQSLFYRHGVLFYQEPGPQEPAYFVGNENGIEDTDAPPEHECTKKSMR